MHVLIVAPEQIPIPPLLGGSVEISILAIARKLARLHRVTIVSRAHPKYSKHSHIDGIDVYRVPTGGPRTYLSQVLGFIKGKHFDLVQVDNRPRFVGPIKRMFPGIPVCLFLHSLTFVSPPFTSRSSAARELTKADLIIANSSSLKHQLSMKFPGISGRIRKVWLGVDTNRFAPAKRASQRKNFRVLFAGRVIPRKGVPILLHAVKQAQAAVSTPIQVVIAGGSSRAGYLNKMRSLARKLRVKSRFLGTVPHRRIHKVFRKADVFVCPSQQHEAFGLVNVEAMASGLPVIASSNGGIKEIVRHKKNGLLIKDYHRPQAFAKAIAWLINNRHARHKMKLQARSDSLSRFSWGTSAKRLSRVYTQLRK